VKGDTTAGKNTQLKFNVHTPVSEPATNGGGCSAADDAAHKCHDHFSKIVPITTAWTRVNIKWADLKQNCPSTLPAGYNPAKEILTMSFSVANAKAGYDFWIDNFTFDAGDLTSNGFGDIVSQATFNELWFTTPTNGAPIDQRNPFYTYNDLVSVAGGYAGFCSTGADANLHRMEAAAFLANIGHETDSLHLVEETCGGTNACNYDGGANYHGRGPIQLTGLGNYNAAGAGIGVASLGSNPAQVSTNAQIAWKTGFWFWMTQAGAGSQAAHFGIGAGSFGNTIQSINGALECGGRNAAAVANRVKLYTRFCYYLGIDPGAMAGLGC
jgi:predicted chitinase